MNKIELRNISKKYGKVTAVKNLSFDIIEKEFLTLLGPSGCGKTTTLRMLAGLEEPSSGEIFFNGDLLFSKEKGVYIPPEKRNLGFMFQSYALWPHMKVYRNISLGLESRKIKAQEIYKRVNSVLEKVQLEGFEDRYPSELSGGQQQRVALARMIAAESDIFLMDEPLSNLDAMLRVDMRSELKRLHKELGATTIYVTHDQVEALTLSDRIVVMNEGEIMQCASPEVIYKKPANLFVAKFVGSPRINIMKGSIENDNGKISFVNEDLNIDLGNFKMNEKLSQKNLIAAIRSEDISIKKEKAEKKYCLRVYSVLPAGSETIITMQKGNSELTVKISGFTDILMDDILSIKVAPEKISFYDPETEELIF